MTDRFIHFSGPMVRALLDGRKTQTRRVLKPQPFEDGYFEGPVHMDELSHSRFTDGQSIARFSCSAVGGGAVRETGVVVRYAPDDRLWVREAWATERAMDRDTPAEIGANCLEAGYDRPWAPLLYMADERVDNRINGTVFGRTRSSRHMPRWASRLTLIVADVRVQRVQEISEEDAVAEGFHLIKEDKGGVRHRYHPGYQFRALWDSLNAKRGYGWEANPWVAAYTFTVHHQNIDKMEAV